MPNPSIVYLKNFENDISKLLWGDKVHRVKKSTFVQDYCHGVSK